MACVLTASRSVTRPGPFESVARFSQAQFESGTEFDEARFARVAGFNGARFGGGAGFTAAPCASAVGPATVVLVGTFAMVAAVNIALAVTSAVLWPVGSALGCVAAALCLARAARPTPTMSDQACFERELVVLSSTARR